MAAAKEYESRLDAKRRLTLRGPDADRFRVVHRRDGTIVLKPLVVMERSALERKARLEQVITEAKAKGENVPESVKLAAFRKPTAGERARMNRAAKELGPLARKRLAGK